MARCYSDDAVDWPSKPFLATEAFESTGTESFTLDFADPNQLTLLIFYGHDCPISNRYVPEIKRLTESYTSAQIRLLLVMPGNIDATTAKAHFSEFDIKSIGIIDRKLSLTKHYGIKTLPEVALLKADGQLVYRGRIDDLYIALGQKRKVVTQFDLRNAIDETLAGNAVTVRETKAIGCIINLGD
jgi:hypothetical protein